MLPPASRCVTLDVLFVYTPLLHHALRFACLPVVLLLLRWCCFFECRFWSFTAFFFAIVGVHGRVVPSIVLFDAVDVLSLFLFFCTCTRILCRSGGVVSLPSHATGRARE